jgi:hypothetical protein
MTLVKSPDIFCPKQKVTIYLSELVKKKSLLFLRFTHNNCVPCYEAEMQRAQDTFRDQPELVTFLSSYYSIDNFSALTRQNKVMSNIYHISFDAFDWIMEEHNKPYYFVIHPDMRISHIFIPNSDFPNISQQYLKSVKRFLSN